MDAKLKYCQACLCSERKLYPVAKMYTIFQEISLWEMKSSQGGICWECRKILVKFTRFKAQVQTAQKALTMIDTEKTDLKCLSSLSFVTITSLQEYTYSQDPLYNEKKEIEVKVETEDVKYSDDGCEDNDFMDSKPVENVQGIYAEILDTKAKDAVLNIKVRQTVKRKKKRIKLEKGVNIEKDVMKKFTAVVLTEEEMVKYREEKKNQPNYMKLPFKCDMCVLGFTKKENYYYHMEKKHDVNIGPYICPTCSIRFTTEQLLERHRKKHYLYYRCHLCKYETTEIKTAWTHSRSKHVNDTEGCRHCGCCDFVATTSEELSEHMKAEHSVLCNECGEKFKGPDTLKSHKRRIHNGVKREFQCDICSRAFKTKSRLESHMANHNSTIAQKLAYCTSCNIQYKNIYVYRNHLRTSANHADQMYQCRECNKHFASKVYWKKHYNFYHLHKSQYRCDLCNKLFISQWRLKNHKSTQHGLSRSRDHHCNVCGKQFFTLSTLKGHQLTHSEQRSFMCEDCGDTFKQRPALYTHYKLVHRGMKRRK